MTSNKYLDSFITGVIIGLLSVTLDYIVLYNINNLLIRITDNERILNPPKLQLIILAVNILLFRFLMIKWDKPRTGKGLLVVLVSVTFWYIYNHKEIL